jgi:hypothetical protein
MSRIQTLWVCGALLLLASVGCTEQVVDEVLARADAAALESSKARLMALPDSREGAEPDLQSRLIVVGAKPGQARCLKLPNRNIKFGKIGKFFWKWRLPDFKFGQGLEYLSIRKIKSDKPALRQKYVPNEIGTHRVIIASGITAHSSYRIVQSVFFEPGWDWGGDPYEGGKLGFGLGGGTMTSGGAVDSEGFTARLMWRGNNDGTGRLVVYSYAADRERDYGEDLILGEFVAPIGEWMDVALELNTNSSTTVRDGSVKVWIDGKLMLNEQGIGWQLAGKTPMVDSIIYSSFYGGNDASWSPERTTYARVKDVCWAPVVDGYSGIDPDNGRYLVK